jgi:hypothetical protein
MVKPGQNATEAPVLVSFTTRDGRQTTTLLSTGLNIAAGLPESPMITNPDDSSTVNGAVSIAGTALPNSLVRVKVDYKSTLGGLLPVTGSAGTHEVLADRDGHWTVSDVPADFGDLFGGDRDTELTVTATNVDLNGEESPGSTITVDGGRVYAHRRGQE